MIKVLPLESKYLEGIWGCIQECQIEETFPWMMRLESFRGCERWFSTSLLQAELGNEVDWVVLQGDTVVGMLGLQHLDFSNLGANVGYWLAPKYRAQNIMKHALKIQLPNWLQEWHRLEFLIPEKNEASLKIVQELGAVLEGYKRDAYLDKGNRENLALFSILSEVI